MKTIRVLRFCVVVCLLAMGFCLPCGAQDDAKGFAVHLTDSSRIVCRPMLDKLPIETSYAKVEVALKSIASL